MAIFNGADLSRIVINQVQNEFDELLKKLETEVKEQDVLYWDTETNNDLPVSLGLYQKSATESFMKSMFLSYGKGGTAPTNGQNLVKYHEKTIEEILKAANMTDKFGKLLESSDQIWMQFTGHKAPANYNSQDSQKELLTSLQKKFSDPAWVKANVLDIDQVVDIFMKANNLAGYNTDKFDIAKMKAYYKVQGQKLGADVAKKFIGKLNQTRDLRQNTRNFAAQARQITGINSDFLGGQTLQDFVTLMLGSADENAHRGDADAYSTALLDTNLDAVGNFFTKLLDTVLKTAQQQGLSLTEIDSQGRTVYSQGVKTLLKEVMSGLAAGSNYTSANTTIKNQPVNTNNATQIELPVSVKNAVSDMAVKKVKVLYNQYGANGNIDAQKALTGSHLLERMRRLGKEVSNITPAFYGEDISSDSARLAEGSMAYYLAQIADTAEANGMGVEFYPSADGGLSIGFYNKDDMIDGQIDASKISKIEIGMVDKSGLVNLGNRKLVNMLVPTLQWSQDKNGNPKANTYLSSVQEEQLEAISRSIKSDRFKSQMQNGDFTGASRFLGYIRNQQLSQAPSGVSQNVLDEIKIKQGRKNPEEMVGLLQRVSFAKLTESLYSNSKFQSIVNDIYAEKYNEDNKKNYRYKDKTVDAYNLTAEERNAVTLAIGLMAQNEFNEDDLSAVNNLQDSIEKRILSNKDLRNYIRRDIQPFISNGLVPNTRSIKEEHVLAQQFSFGGSEDITFGGYLVDPSQRAETQKYNYFIKALGNKASRSPFYSPIGEANGINYQDNTSQGVYTGATVTDSEIYKALTEVLKRMNVSQEAQDEILNQISVHEGGVVMPQSMAEELMTYTDFIKEVSDKANILSKISKITGLSKDGLKNAAVGTQFISGKSLPLDRDIKIGDIELKANDIIDGIEKTEKGFKVIGGYLTQATEGTKILGGNAGRYTFRGLDDNIYSELLKEMGLNSDTKFLAEIEGISQRKLSTNFRGRLGYIVTEAQRMGKTTDEITQALKAMPVIGKAITEKNGQYNLNVTYDTLSHDYKYHDTNGIQKSLFNTDDNGNLLKLTPEELDARVAQALVEQTENSSLSVLGKQLLGDEGYAKSLQQIAASLSTARIVPYYTPTGGASAKDAEAKGGVKITRKERDALNSSFGVYEYGLSDEAKAGYDAYSKLQKSRFSDFGPRALQAQKNIEELANAYNNKNIINSRQDQIELTWDSSGSWVTDGNKINLAQVVTNYEYSSDGIAKDEWSKTIGAKIQELKAQIPNAQLILNAQKIASETGLDLSGSKLLRLADIEDSEFKDGMMPSVTNSAYSSLVNRIKDALTTGAKFDISEEVDKIYDIMKTAGTDKDSSLFQDSQSVYLSHATHAKAVGLNQVAIDQKYATTGDIKLYNTAYANKGYISSMLRSNKKATVLDMAKNIQELSYMLRASGGIDKLKALGTLDDNDIERLTNFENSKILKNSTQKDLKEIEESIIDYIIQYMENGGLLLAQSHRYPSTSGLDIHSSFLGLNNRISDGAIAIGRGQSAEFNADYDGDTTQHWLAMAGFRNTDLNGKYEDYAKAYKAAEALSLKESEIAKHLADWEAQANAPLTGDKLEEDIKNKTRELAASVGSASRVTDISAFMSKWNKQYVGRFSNPYTNLRRNKTMLGFGELNANSTLEEKQMAANSLLINAFFESLEQDAISAKKVQARLLKKALAERDNPDAIEEEGTAIINELTELVDLFKSGKFEDAFNLAVDKGIVKVDKNGVIDGRQFEFARGVIQQLDPEVSHSLFGNINGNFGVNSKDLIASFKKLENYAATAGFSLGDLTIANKVDGSNQRGEMAVEKFLTETFNKYRKVTQEVDKNGNYTSKIDPEKVNSNTNVKYEAYLSKQGKDFGKNHKYEAFNFDGTEVGELEDSVTNLVKPHIDKNKLSDDVKRNMESASRKGTYMHHLLELAIKYGVDSISDVFVELQKDENAGDKDQLEQEYALAFDFERQTKGFLGPDFDATLRRRADSLYQAARNDGLITKDRNTKSEVKMGMNIPGIGKIGGSADLINFYRDDSGKLKARIADWKFSSRGGEKDSATTAAWLLQTSEYAHMQKQKYKDLLDYMNINGQDSFTDSDGDVLSKNDVQERLEAFDDATIEILRSFIDKSGNLRKEIIRADGVISQDTVETIMKMIQATGTADYSPLGNYMQNRIGYEQFNENGDSISYNGRRSQRSQNAQPSKQEQEYKKLLEVARAPGATKFLSNAYEDASLTQEGLQKLSGADSILGEFDTSSMTMAKRFNEYSKALIDSRKAIKDIIKANTNIADLEQKKKELTEDTSSDHTETLTLLDEEIKKQQILLKIAQDKAALADKRREDTKIDEEVENGTADAKTAVKRHELLTQTKSALNKDVQGMTHEREGQPTIVDNVLKGDKDVTQYLNNLKQRQKIEAQIYEMQQKMKGESGETYKNSQKYVQSLQSTLKVLEQTAPQIDTAKLTEEQKTKLINQQNILYQEQEDRIAKINTKQQYSQNFLSKFVGGLKQSFSQFSAANVAFSLTNDIRRSITEILQYTEQMDSVLVDLQIASGYTRESVYGLMLEYNELGKELGKSTIDVANAANDWLRAGYEGKEATELTRASTQLATLGMINTADATSYLISVLKGWKLEASEVSEVVDKLTAVDMAAAISAGDLAEAMSRANNSAQMAGISMDKYIGILTTAADITQRSPESIGESMKTIISRYTNVKAGKFVASQEEQQSDSYDESNYEALNDVEKVLDSIGIKIRENANEFRDLEDVLDEIANKWDTYDDTTRNAIGTALFGTRQREIGLTIFENWEQVGKYSDIAANSYGTAEKKMEAFADSVEAAKNRISVAVQGWALEFNGSEIMKLFYNTIANVVENLHLFIAALTTIIAIANRGAVLNGAMKVLNGINGFLNNLGFAYTNQNLDNKINYNGFVKNTQSFVDNVNESYLSTLREQYAKNLTILNKDATEEHLQNVRILQNKVLSENSTLQALWTQNQVTEEQIRQLTLDEKKMLADDLLLTITGQENKTRLEAIKAMTKETAATEISAELAEILNKAKQEKVVETMTGNVTDYTGQGKTPGGFYKGAKDTAIAGFGNLLLGFTGGELGSTIGTALGGDNGKLLGTMIGGLITPGITNSILSGLASIGPTAAAIFGGAFTPIVGVVALGILNWVLDEWLNGAKKRAEEAAQEFSDTLNKYNDYKSASSYALKYDDLVKGVDALGRNVSLTDDEYQTFLDTSNQLAEIFPELVQYTDGAGNSFLGMGGKVTQASDSISELVEQQKRATNQALLQPDLFSQNYKEAYAEYLGYKREKTNKEKQISDLDDLDREGNEITFKDEQDRADFIEKFNSLGLGVSVNTNGWDNNGYKAVFNTEDLNKIEQALADFKTNIKSDLNELDTSMSKARAKLADEVSAILEEMSYDSQYEFLFDGMSDELKNITQIVASSVDFQGENETPEEFKQRLQDTIAEITKVFKNNPNLLESYFNLDNYDTQGEVSAARDKLAKDLQAAFGENFDPDGPIGKILVNWGFKFDGNSIVDDTNTFDKLKEVVKGTGVTLDRSITKDWYNSLSTEEANKVFEYYRTGKANSNTSRRVLQNMLGNDMADNSVSLMIEQFDRLSASMPVYTARVHKFFTDVLQKGSITAADVSNAFSDMPETIRNGLENSSNELLDAFNALSLEAQDVIIGGLNSDNFTEYVDNYFNDIDSASQEGLTPDGHVISESAKETAKEFAKEFGDELQSSIDSLDLQTFNLRKQILGQENSKMWTDAGVDGIIDTYSELKSVLDSMSESFDKLKAAQDEYNKTGKVSLETALDLLSTNELYALALEPTTNGLKLKANAAEIMAKAQYELMLANVEATISEKEQAIQEAQSELAALSNGETYVQTSNDKIGATEQEVNALNASTEAYQVNTNAMRANAQMKVATLSGNINAINSAIAASDATTKNVGKTSAPKVKFNATQVDTTNMVKQREERMKQLRKMVGDFDQDEGTFSGGYLDSELKIYKSIKTRVEDILATNDFSYSTFDKLYNAPDSSSSSGKDKKATDYLDKLEKIHDLIDKDWEAMLAFNANRETEYYDKRRNSINKQIAEIDRITANADKYIASGMLKEDDLIELQKKRIDLAKELADLDDEALQDKQEILNTIDATLASQIKLQEELLATSDTEKERVERQKELNDLVKQEAELRMEINDWEKDSAERAQKYLSGTAFSNSRQYDVYTNLRKQAIQASKEEAYNNYATIVKNKEIDFALEGANGGNHYTSQEIYNLARESADAREALDKYFDYVQEENDLINEAFEAKVSEIDTRINELEKTKPENWGHLVDIQPYYNNTINLITAKIGQIEEALSNTQGMTDEQIQSWVDKYNEAIQALYQAQKSALEDITNYQSNQFSALTNWIEEYKDTIQDIKDDTDDYYDDLIDKLKDYNEDLDRTNNLLEKQKNLQDALKEKQRVYREGIGWVYESPRDKVKSAQKDLDDFYRQDQIDDLNDTKDAEDQILQDKIDSLDLYLKALNWQYTEQERIERDRLLAELMNLDESMSNAEKQKAIHDTIISDWHTFNINCEGNYKDYNQYFSDFLDEYTVNMGKLQELQRQTLSIMSSLNMLGVNNSMANLFGNISDTSQIAQANGMSPEDMAALEAYGKAWNDAKAKNDQKGMDAAHAGAEAIRAKYGYSGGADGSAHYMKEEISNLEDFNKKLDTNYKKQALIEIVKQKNDNQNNIAYKTSTGETKTISANMLASWVSQNDNLDAQYKLITGNFSEFLSDNADNISRYQEQQKQLQALGNLTISGTISATGTTSSSGSYKATSGGGMVGDDAHSSSMSASDKAALAAAGKAYNSATSQAEKDKAHAAAEAIRNKYNYSGGADGSQNISTKKSQDIRSYSSGIENGPVTYTGLAMLHGSANKPEFVLNSDQAYNLIYNMSSGRLNRPVYESTAANNAGDIYNLYGDINLEDCDNPAEFWDAVMSSASNRWQVTKNKK